MMSVDHQTCSLVSIFVARRRVTGTETLAALFFLVPMSEMISRGRPPQSFPFDSFLRGIPAVVDGQTDVGGGWRGGCVQFM